MGSEKKYSLNYKQNCVDALREKTADLQIKNTICDHTERVQAATAELAKDVDAMIVIGGRSSSNTRKLAEICSHECKKTFFVQTAADLIPGSLASCDRIGITAGASTPKHIIEEVQTIVGSEF